ncbi:MAG: hypothetical protein RLZZ196_2422, partial [Bacteroidota bacterium]
QLDETEYLYFLTQFQPIYNHIERFSLPCENMERDERAMVDLSELRSKRQNLFTHAKPLQVAFHYMQYLLTLDFEKTKPHVYVNYLFLLNDGQTIKNNIHGTGRIYMFENLQNCIDSIIAISTDEMVDEANIALDYYIAIFDELDEISEEFKKLNNG